MNSAEKQREQEKDLEEIMKHIEDKHNFFNVPNSVHAFNFCNSHRICKTCDDYANKH